MKIIFKCVAFLFVIHTYVCVSAQNMNAGKKKKSKKEKKDLALPKVTEAFIDSIQNSMVWVTGGSFIMGNDAGEPDERPAYEVVVDGYAISKYPVTQRQWSVIMGTNPTEFAGCDQCPIDKVSWNDAQKFIAILNELTGKKFSLPTEAEWEYAAKGGKESKPFKYAGSNDIDSVAWYTGNSGRMPHPVGQKLPNALGLYDMCGNVWEWCLDWYNKNYYELNESNNPMGPSSGAGRVRRGGSWFTQAINCKTTTRNNVKQDYSDDSGGFRLVQYPN